MRPLTLLLLLPSVLISDTKTVVKTTSTCCVTVNTSYAQGEKRRYEYESGATSLRGAVHTGTLFTAHQIQNLDFQAKQYTESPLPNPFQQPPLPRALLASPELVLPQTGSSGKSVDIYYETIDTGERKEIFGKMTRHLILRTRTVAESGACEQSRTAQRDGWYIIEPQSKAPAYHLALGTVMILGGQRCLDTKRVHGAFPFLQAMVETSTEGSKRELLELSDSPLDPHLFDLPAGFKKVDRLPPPPLTWDQTLSREFGYWIKLIESWLN